MKQALYLLFFFILLLVAFIGGARFSQRGAVQANPSTERAILHYIDPMNPAHTSKEPGIAPCGMPMEPVYADDGTPASLTSAVPGTVRVNPNKRQTIGVQVAEATTTAHTAAIRALGRIDADENRVYPLVAASDGWLGETNAGTTGSLVHKGQLLAEIEVFNYDFFTWQQRYLTELGYANRLSVEAPPVSVANQSSPVSAPNQSRRRTMSGAGYEAGLPIPESEARMIKRGVAIAQLSREAEQQRMVGAPPAPVASTRSNKPQIGNQRPESPRHLDELTTTHEKFVPKPQGEHAEHMGNTATEVHQGPGTGRERNPHFASRARQELLNAGVTETQLASLQKTGTYITHVDLRSPVNGYILSRAASPLQRIDRGTECFRVADLGRVWIEADVFDQEAGLIQPGMQARVSLPRRQEHREAKVAALPPRYDAASRSLRVRLEMDNPDLAFRPGMFVDVEVQVDLPAALTVPATAVVDTGRRQIVYVAVAEGVFEPRPVVTGWRFNDRVEIVQGLQAGEKIAVSGTFLIDSESRMKLAAAGLMEQPVDRAATAPPVIPPPPTEPVAAPAPPPPQAAAPAPAVARPSREAKAAAVKPIDPVCGMRVDLEQARATGLTVEVEGATHAFCSEDCRQQFLQDPSRFAGKPGNAPPPPPSGHDGHHHD